MRIPNRFLLLGGALILAALIGGFFNALHPALDSLSHFRLHLAVLGVVLAGVLVVLGNPLGSAALGVISVLSFGLTVWPTIAARDDAETDKSASYRLVQANLRFDNRRPEEFLRLVAEFRPDVVTLQEVSDLWATKLQAIRAAYPHQLVCPGTNLIGGVAIVARRPFAPDGLSFCGKGGALAVQTVDFNGKWVTVASIHLKWPWPHTQPQQLAAMQANFDAIAAADGQTLIGGDMNAAPWSAAVETIASSTGTHVLPQVRGTWLLPALPKSWVPFVGLPIDNVLAGDLTIRSATSLPDFGSDHRPILVEFTLPSNDVPTGESPST